MTSNHIKDAMTLLSDWETNPSRERLEKAVKLLHKAVWVEVGKEIKKAIDN